MSARTTEDLGSTTAGVWSRADALAAVSRGTLQHKVATGEWQELLPGAYLDGGLEPGPVQRAVAAVLATGEELSGARSRIRAVACGRTAARVHGLPLIDDDDPSTGRREHVEDDVHTFRAARGRWTPVEHQGRQLVRHRLTLLAGDLVEHESGLVLTSALRTACDCARLLAFDAAVAVVDDGLHRGLFTCDDLTGALRQRVGWPGVRRLAAVVAAADGRAESPAETVARLVLLPVLPSLVPRSASATGQAGSSRGSTSGTSWPDSASRRTGRPAMPVR